MPSLTKRGVKHSLVDEHAPKVGHQDSVAQSLEALVELSQTRHEGHVDTGKKGGGVYRVFSGLSCGFLPTQKEVDDEFAKWKMGTYIAVRGTDKQFFEDMPLYVRVGMHLLFYGSKKSSLLRWGSVEELLQKMTAREGVIYDDESDPAAVQDFIRNFITTYKIETKDLVEQDLTKYPSRNSFFYRKLRPEARPVAEQSNDKVISSAADCRLTVFASSQSAKEIWIKGKRFSILSLINASGSSKNKMSEDSSLAIFRLAPADYHRYNHPVGPAKVVAKSHTGSEYYTVNPDAVNENFDVFTGNIRDITMMEWTIEAGKRPLTVALVSVGALLVGANRFTGAEQGQTYRRGVELGYFAYGGSTVIAVFPPEAKVKWDEDLMANSLKGLETLVKVGERIGVSEM